MNEPAVRRAAADDARLIADVYLQSREDAGTAIPPGVHPPDDVRRYVREQLLAEYEVWLHGRDGVLALHDGDLHWLWVRPAAQGRGVGSALVAFAKARHPGGLALWVFASNTPAIRFYERHGFREVRRTDGDNEEHAPDVRMVWGDHPEG